jgi:hypothetical protein
MDASYEENERIVGLAATVSVTDVPQQKNVPGALDPEEEIHCRPQEVRLIFLIARVEIRY